MTLNDKPLLWRFLETPAKLDEKIIKTLDKLSANNRRSQEIFTCGEAENLSNQKKNSYDVFCKIEYNRTVSCRGLFHIAFPLIFNGSSVFMKYSICQTHPRKKKSYLTRNVSRVFCKPNFSYLTDEHAFKSTSTWYQMLVVTEKKEPNKKQNYSGYHLYCMETKNTLKRCIFL